MTEFFQTLYEYRFLLGRKRALGERVGERAGGRLAELEACFASRSLRRRHQRWRIAVPATLRTGGRDLSAIVLELSGGGAMVELSRPVAPGASVVLKIVCETTGRHYRLPARVVHSHELEVGVCFTGLPVELRMISAYAVTELEAA